MPLMLLPDDGHIHGRLKLLHVPCVVCMPVGDGLTPSPRNWGAGAHLQGHWATLAAWSHSVLVFADVFWTAPNSGGTKWAAHPCTPPLADYSTPIFKVHNIRRPLTLLLRLCTHLGGLSC